MEPHEQSRSERAGIAPGFGRRLSYYVFGIAIGLLMLGLINQARQRSASNNGAQQNSASDPESATRPPREQDD